MELLVARTSDPEASLRLQALETMVKEVRTSTSSMTSVPKPLKFLRPHYGTLKANHASATPGPAKTLLADVLSLLAMTMAEEGVRDSLNYKLLGSRDDLGSWGHEYVRHLSGEIGAEYNERLSQAEAAAEAAKEGGDAMQVDGASRAATDSPCPDPRPPSSPVRRSLVRWWRPRRRRVVEAEMAADELPLPLPSHAHARARALTRTLAHLPSSSASHPRPSPHPPPSPSPAPFTFTFRWTR